MRITHTKERSLVIQPDLLGANQAWPFSLNSFDFSGSNWFLFRIMNNRRATPVYVCAHIQVMWGRSISETNLVDLNFVITFSLINEHIIVSSRPNNNTSGQFLIPALCFS